MRRTLLAILSASLGVVLACSDRAPTSPEIGMPAVEASSSKATGRDRHVVVVSPRSNGFVLPGVWGSENASLTVTQDGAKLDLLSQSLPTGGCFGSYGEIPRPIPNGPFSIAGTFTQLTGVYPGKIQYAAQHSGVVEADKISLTVLVPELRQSFGPFLLARGVSNSWTPCLYP